jgi:hypothetical protein
MARKIVKMDQTKSRAVREFYNFIELFFQFEQRFIGSFASKTYLLAKSTNYVG